MSFSGYTQNSQNKKARKKNMQNSYYKKETVAEIRNLPLLPVEDMSLSEIAAKYYKIRSAVSEEDGQTITATYIPSYDKYGKLTGYKKRDWTIPKEEDYHFTTVGVVKASNQLFGQKEASQGNNKKQINLVEGEGDCTASFDAFYHKIKSMSRASNQSLRKYAEAMLDGIQSIIDDVDLVGNPTIPIVSLNCGAGNAVESVANNEKFVKGYDKIVLGFDNDSASEVEKQKGVVKGKEATDNVAGFLLSENIFVFQFPHEVNDPKGYKDQRDMVDDGKGDEVYKLFTKCDSVYVPDKLISLSDVSVENLRKKKKDGIPLEEFPKLMDITRGPRRGELWTITGPSGAGKSTVSKKIEYAIVQYLRGEGPKLEDWTEEEKCAIIHLEEDEEETINCLYAQELGVDNKAFVAEPDKFISVERHTEIHQKWIDENKVRIFDHFGSIPIKDLIQKLKQMVFLDNCRWIVLDHLSMVISGLGLADERKALDVVMTDLAAFCKQYDVFILVVSHMKRKEIQPAKNKSGDPLPFWYPVRKEDLRGSAALEQLSWIVLGVEPEELPDRSRGRCRVVSLKNRPHKRLGVADTFWMDENDKLIDASGWHWNEDASEFEKDNYDGSF